MVGEFVERFFDACVEIGVAAVNSKAGEPGGAKRVVGKQAVNVAAGDAPIGSRRAVCGAAILHTPRLGSAVRLIATKIGRL